MPENPFGVICFCLMITFSTILFIGLTTIIVYEFCKAIDENNQYELGNIICGLIIGVLLYCICLYQVAIYNNKPNTVIQKVQK